MRFWLIVVIVLFIGCGEKAEPPVYITNPIPADIYSVTPSSGEIAPNEAITVIFTKNPTCVSARPGSYRVSGKIVTIIGPFLEGPLWLRITWGWNEFEDFDYTVVDKTDKE